MHYIKKNQKRDMKSFCLLKKNVLLLFNKTSVTPKNVYQHIFYQ